MFSEPAIVQGDTAEARRGRGSGARTNDTGSDVFGCELLPFSAGGRPIHEMSGEIGTMPSTVNC